MILLDATAAKARSLGLSQVKSNKKNNVIATATQRRVLRSATDGCNIQIIGMKILKNE